MGSFIACQSCSWQLLYRLCRVKVCKYKWLTKYFRFIPHSYISACSNHDRRRSFCYSDDTLCFLHGCLRGCISAACWCWVLSSAVSGASSLWCRRLWKLTSSSFCFIPLPRSCVLSRRVGRLVATSPRWVCWCEHGFCIASSMCLKVRVSWLRMRVYQRLSLLSVPVVPYKPRISFSPAGFKVAGSEVSWKQIWLVTLVSVLSDYSREKSPYVYRTAPDPSTETWLFDRVSVICSIGLR